MFHGTVTNTLIHLMYVSDHAESLTEASGSSRRTSVKGQGRSTTRAQVKPSKKR